MPLKLTPGQRVRDEGGFEYVVVQAKRNGMVILRERGRDNKKRYYAWKNGNKLGYSYFLGELQKRSA